jgi:hypothetical protein
LRVEIPLFCVFSARTLKEVKRFVFETGNLFFSKVVVEKTSILSIPVA